MQAEAVVIGAGTAGLNAFNALRAWGIDALLVDRGPLGTTCARVGCMPSKAVLHASAQWRTLAHGTVSQEATGTQPRQLWQQALAVRDELVQGMQNRTQAVGGERLVLGQARFTGPHTLDVVDGERTTTITAKTFILATGTHPIVPAALQALGDKVLTTDQLFALPAPPASLGILGLGAVGLEMGIALQRLGTRVMAADLQPFPAGLTDPVAAAQSTEWLGRELDMHLGQAARIEASGGQLRFSVGDRSALVDQVLVAVGRAPNWEALELHRAIAGLPDASQKALNTQTLQVLDAPVFAAGDVTGIRPLMHEAQDEGRIAAASAARYLGHAVPATSAQRRIPLSIVFTHPDIAQVGTPWHALDMAHTVVGTARGAGNGRSKVMHARDNLLRIYADRRDGRLLGACIVAERGEHLAHLLAWAVMRGETVYSLQELPTYHPCVEEMIPSALQDAARQCTALCAPQQAAA